MERISAEEFAAHAADYVRRAAAGESFEVATSDHAVARLSLPRTALRVAEPASRRGGWLDLEPGKVAGPSSQEVLDELRKDRT